MTSARVRHKRHGFDILRIAAASAVLVGHAFLLTGADLFPVSFSDTRYALGAVGVFVFFSISGYLVTGSWMREPHIGRFAEKRVRRIWPALAVMVLVTALIVGPLFSNRDRYYTELDPWQYIARNLLVLPYQQEISGTFATNPFHEVNGVIWTLGVEVLAYAALAIAGYISIIKKLPWLLLAAAVACALIGWPELTGDYLPNPLIVRVGLLSYFFIGAFVKAVGAERVLTPYVVVPLIAACGLLSILNTPVSIVAVPAIAVSSLYVGTRQWAWAETITSKGDPSYGAYIFGYPIQQMFVHNGWLDENPLLFSVVSVILGLAAGYISWHALEKRVLHPRRKSEVQAGGATLIPSSAPRRPDHPQE
jgi:peptidoglycan/LPS O-acetylase OafA/YrhL